MGTEQTSLELDAKAKKEAYAVFKRISLKPAQAINLFLRQVALRGGFPFEAKLPNAVTSEAMQGLDKGDSKAFKNTEEFYKDLGI